MKRLLASVLANDNFHVALFTIFITRRHTGDLAGDDCDGVKMGSWPLSAETAQQVIACLGFMVDLFNRRQRPGEPAEIFRFGWVNANGVRGAKFRTDTTAHTGIVVLDMHHPCKRVKRIYAMGANLGARGALARHLRVDAKFSVYTYTEGADYGHNVLLVIEWLF